jgi:tellurite resistance protein TehA-like permease
MQAPECSRIGNEPYVFSRINERSLDRFNVFCFGMMMGCAISGNWIAFYLTGVIVLSISMQIVLVAIFACWRLKRMGWPGRMV